MPTHPWSDDAPSPEAEPPTRKRFGLGALLLAMAYVAVVFAVFGAVGARWQTATLFLACVSWVGICRVMLTSFASPMVVSAVAGGLFTVAWTICVTYHKARYPAFAMALVPTFMLGTIVGVAAGYINSCLSSAHEFLETLSGARRAEHEALRVAQGKPPRESPFDD